MLANIHSPKDIKNLSYEQCESLADDIRWEIIKTTSQNGGHLASNLGMVEITLAMHRVFNTPTDKIVYDVGHQTYTHKLITGRYDKFHTLRTYKGLSGFPRREESEYDCFEVGHASTALSAALGMARARDIQKQDHHVIAVVGDGALTGGMCYEALNDCGNSKTRMIVILNDNEMSIAQNVGALSSYFSKLRASKNWIGTKKNVKFKLAKIPKIGMPLINIIHNFKNKIKNLLFNEVFFSALGFQYMGPLNGNDLPTLEKMLNVAKMMDEPVVIHCATKKGYGYNSAEAKPEMFHGTPPFFIESGKTKPSTEKSNGKISNELLIELAKTDNTLQVITAAMQLGTGTNIFAKNYPERFWDVGIAEEHAVTLAAGMAISGLKPILFIYSTFLQRGYDQVLIDVCLQNLPVLLMMDRAGITNEDGKSHQGLFDIAYLRHIPNLTLFAPGSVSELEQMIKYSLKLATPCAIRYPKSFEKMPVSYANTNYTMGKWQEITSGNSAVLLACGSMLCAALRVYEKLLNKDIKITVVNASTIKPLDHDYLINCYKKNIKIFTLEEHVLMGGFGSSVLEHASVNEYQVDLFPMGVQDIFVPHGDHEHLLKDVGLSDDQIFETILNKIESVGEKSVD